MVLTYVYFQISYAFNISKFCHHKFHEELVFEFRPFSLAQIK